MYLSELKQIALENGENKSSVTRTIDTLQRSVIGTILEPKYGIRRSRNPRNPKSYPKKKNLDPYVCAKIDELAGDNRN